MEDTAPTRVTFDELSRVPAQRLARLLLDRAAEDPTLLSRLYQTVDLRESAPSRTNRPAIVGDSLAMRRVMALVRRLEQTDEPVLVTGRVVAPAPGFLAGVETLARRHGALTILDDCLMLRLAVGGSAEKFSLEPDLVVLGKFLGGGTPLGAFGGSRDLMKIFDPTHPGCVFHGGSFNGNRIGCAAGLVTMQELTAQRIAGMDAATERLRTGLASRSSCRA